ncbi:MAG: ATP-dependent zinc metalloprotease FtsH [Flavobacteriales bacterium]|nr:ATP-dependent zinc metalloprotease FtsH [Flavobacteriales bacterium]
MSENENKNKKKTEGQGQGGGSFYWIFAVVAGILLMLTMFGDGGALQEKTIPELKQMVEDGEIEKVLVVNRQFAEVTLTNAALDSEKYRNKVSKPLFGMPVSSGPHFITKFGDMEHFNSLLIDWQENYAVAYSYDIRQEWGRELLQWVLLLGIMIAIWVFVMRKLSGGGGPGGQIFNIGKSRAKIFDKGKGTNVTFSDVAGLEGAKEEVQEIVDFLKHPQKYTELGAKIPKGALLVGPPGTGKTLLAKAVAGEAQVPFFSLSGSDFVEMFVGVGASRVRDLFKQAKEKAPAIIFIDEIDAIGRARGKSISMGSNDERENTLNQLLTEMDGFGTNSGVIILAATNRADILDRALMRAGRFDRQIFVDMPDLNERKAIFEVHVRPIKVDDSVDIDFLARQTPGFSGADIANICNEAALIAARKKKKSVGKQDFLDAVDRIIGGLEKKNKIITPREKEVIAFHEAGHATVSWLVDHASPLVKVTIVPRGQSLGAAWYLPEERQITTTEQMLDEMCATLGGRAAEEIVFGKISTGALSDLEKVTKQAYAMVTMYGLDEKLGNISYYDSSGQSDYTFSKPYSEKTAELIDQEVSAMIETAYERAKEILSANKDKLTELAHQLVKEEVIFKEDLEKIFGMKAETDNAASILHIANEKKKTTKEDDIPVVEEVAPKEDSKVEGEEMKDDSPDHTEANAS